MSQPMPLCWPDPLQGFSGRHGPQKWRRQMPTGAGQSKCTTPVSSVLAHTSAVTGQLTSLAPSVW